MVARTGDSFSVALRTYDDGSTDVIALCGPPHDILNLVEQPRIQPHRKKLNHNNATINWQLNKKTGLPERVTYKSDNKAASPNLLCAIGNTHIKDKSGNYLQESTPMIAEFPTDILFKANATGKKPIKVSIVMHTDGLMLDINSLFNPHSPHRRLTRSNSLQTIATQKQLKKWPVLLPMLVRSMSPDTREPTI